MTTPTYTHRVLNALSHFKQITMNMDFCSFTLMIIVSLLYMSKEQPLTSYRNDYNDSYDNSFQSFLDDDLCAALYSCNSTSQYCMCDVSCDVFKDCCHDAMTSNANTTFVKLTEVLPYADCVYLPEVYFKWFIFVVNFCPFGTEKNLKDLCEQIDVESVTRSTPVVGNTTNLLYRNLYCAICHNEYYTLLNLQLSCSLGFFDFNTGNYTIKELFKLNSCDLEYKIAEGYHVSYRNPIRRCYSAISDCPNHSADDIHTKRCKTGRNEYVFTKNNIYRNKDCYFCSDDSGNDVSCKSQFYNSSIDEKNSLIYSYRMLFDLESGRVKSEKQFLLRPTEYKDFSIGYNCLDTQVFDPFADVCRDITCATGTLTNGLQCKLMNTSIFGNISCTVIEFDEGDYDIVNSTSIFVYNSNKTYHNVVFESNVALVCITVYTSAEFLYRNDPIEGWLSFVCGLVSVACLCITTIVYMLPKLQNQPGRLLLCLCGSLFLAQLLFFLTRNAEIDIILCKILGVLVHFFFLTSFLWMNVMSFDVFNTFSSSFSSVGNNRKHFALYSLYVCLSALVIISIGILMDEMTSWSYRPNYGIGACWITNSKGLIVFLLVPLAIIILLNSVFFALSVRSICITKRESSERLNTRNNCDIFIYIKLSTVMGLTWAFGYVVTWVQNQVFWDLFVISNCLQGLFIFCSFVLNKKVYHVVRECFGIQVPTGKDIIKTSSCQPRANLTVL